MQDKLSTRKPPQMGAGLSQGRNAVLEKEGCFLIISKPANDEHLGSDEQGRDSII